MQYNCATFFQLLDKNYHKMSKLFLRSIFLMIWSVAFKDDDFANEWQGIHSPTFQCALISIVCESKPFMSKPSAISKSVSYGFHMVFYCNLTYASR